MTSSTGFSTRTVNAPAARVYELITDVARMGEWSPECVGVAEAPTQPMAVGCTFVGRNRRGDNEWTNECVVVAADPSRLFSFIAGGDEGTTWSYELVDRGDGTTEVTESFDSAPLRNPELAAQLEGRRDQLVDDLATTLDRLAAAAEAETGAGAGSGGTR